MRLPQELIDSILDTLVLTDPDKHDSVLSQNSPEVQSTLRSCALVSRAFAEPSQRKIFFTVRLGYNYMPFLDLLTASPHIGVFVRTLEATYQLCEDHPINGILTLLLHLECIILNGRELSIDPQHLRHFPTFGASCALAFSLPSVRHIELGHLIFSDVVELESLLRGSTGLKKLSLHSCLFENRDATLFSGGRSISLDSLDLFKISDDKVIESMIDSFAVVDITHLRSLRLHFSAAHSIVAANAASLDEVDIKYSTGIFPSAIRP
ncbi:hypothetical protein B0H16DRAFT_127343 [Mycena metata]|uniref:Uncharacterized protein n=1 Tax=Mycena metata TaxID=1033252 RepID=A0AAD7I5P9_9AGAR|nr:hypothetical protein B0H16DRAFT_127343 [Mycena metata]